MKRSLSAVCCAVASVALAADVTVTDISRVNLTTTGANGGDAVTLSTVSHATYPQDLPAPSFWMDAGERADWTVDADGTVSRIPSKVGGRALVGVSVDSSWTGWGSTRPAQLPVLTDDAELGAKVLDFGNIGSRKALVFDAEDNGGTPVNRLSTIGTIVAVYGSQGTGGWVMGGGLDSQIGWHRATKFSNITQWTAFNPLSDGANGHAAFRKGYTRHNGFNFVPTVVGFTGGWEVFSFHAQTDEAAATLGATGVGVGDAREGDEPATRSGGMKIAEMIIYPTVLTVEQLTAVEDWLQLKWFNRRLIGINGRARIDEIVQSATDGKGTTATVTVREGESLELASLQGGRNQSASATVVDTTVFTGAGEVRLGDAAHYNGDVVLDGATLVREAPRAIPTVSELPSGLFLRFDPSDETTLTTETEGDVTYVTQMRQCGTDAKYGTSSYVLNGARGDTTKFEDLRPYLEPELSPTKLPMVSLDKWYCWVKNDAGLYRGRVFSFNASPKLTTVIAVVDTRYGGSWLMNGGFCRGNQSAQNCSTPILCSQGPNHVGDSNNVDKQNILSSDPLIIAGVDGCAYLDGERVPTSSGYPENSQVVVALQVPGSTPGYVGGYNPNVCGGLVMGEMLCWARPLTEEEIRDASAYLAKRWLGKTLSGYVQAAPSDVPDVQSLKTTAASAVDVDAEMTLRAGKVTLGADLVKRGEGRLAMTAFDAGANRVSLEGGTLAVVAEPDPATAASPAADPAVWFDPSDTSGWTITEANEKPHIQVAVREGQRIVLKNSTAAYAPFMNYEDGPVVDGEPMPVADFGVPAGEYSANNANAHTLFFDHPVGGARSVFSVWLAKADSLAFFMGSGTEGYCGVPTGEAYAWHRGIVSGSCKNGPLFGGSTSSAVKNGTTLTNGAPCAATSWNPSGEGWRMIEVHTAGGAHVSAFGADRGGSRGGGMMMGETLIYDRVLTEREKIATRNYLMKKWFGKADADLEPLPPAPAVSATIPTLGVEDGTTVEATGAAGDTTVIRRLDGEADIAKTGSGTLALLDYGAYSGKVSVATGTLKLAGHRPETPATLPTNGLLLQLDAGKNVTLDANGEVIAWASANGSGWTAKSAKGSYGKNAAGADISVTKNPLLEPENAFDGRKVVNIQPNSCFRLFDPDDQWQAITNIRTVLWVLGSQQGGGFLLGGGDHSGTWMGPGATKPSTSGNAMYYAWHRGGGAGTSKDDSLVSGSGLSYVYNESTWRVNGEAYGATTSGPLSGEWDVISTRLKNYAPADALACDGRIFKPVPEDYRSRCGRQKIAELLIYTNRLSDAELKQAEEYLNLKWGMNGYVNLSASDLSVDVAAGATLDCGDHAQVLSGISGAGTIKGNVSVQDLVADVQGEGLTLDGTFTVPAGVTVELKNIPADLDGKVDIPVLAATAYDGLENLSSAVFTGEAVPTGFKATLRVVDGVLVVRLRPAGMMLFVR